MVVGLSFSITFCLLSACKKEVLSGNANLRELDAALRTFGDIPGSFITVQIM